MKELLLILQAMFRNWLADYLNRKAAKLAHKLEKTQAKWEKINNGKQN